MSHTPLPWKREGSSLVGTRDDSKRGIIVSCPLPKEGGLFEAVENIAFIHAACNQHEALLARVKELEETLDEAVTGAVLAKRVK